MPKDSEGPFRGQNFKGLGIARSQRHTPARGNKPIDRRAKPSQDGQQDASPRMPNPARSPVHTRGAISPFGLSSVTGHGSTIAGVNPLNSKPTEDQSPWLKPNVAPKPLIAKRLHSGPKEDSE